MGKNKRRQQKRRSVWQNPSEGPVIIRADSPFRGIPHDELVQGLLEVGRSYDREFEESLSGLIGRIRAFDPLHLISILSVYGLFAGMTDTGKVQQKKTEATLQQAHVELAQALVLTVPAEDVSANPALPDDIQQIWDLLIKLGDAFHLKRLEQIERATADEEKAILQLQEQLRLHTQFVRNWGYFTRVITITSKLYKPLDPIYENAVGIGATQLIQFFEHLVRRSETAINDRWQRLRPIASARTTDEAVEAYYAAFPDLDGSPDELIEYFREHQAPREAVLSIVLSHHDLQLAGVFTFDVPEVANEIGLDADALRRALPKLSYRFGELRDAQHEHFFLGNPVWLKPLIQLTDDTYFCATPQVFFSFVFPILQELLVDNADVQDSCYRRRAEFLEDQAAELLTCAFGDGEYVRNLKWQDVGTEYESDLLLSADSYLLLVEAKSGAITWPALRGAPDRVRRHVQELLLDPARQSKRLADRLERLRSGDEVDEGILDQLPFDIKKVQKVVRLSVTLEDFATVQSNVTGLKSTGWLEEDFLAAPTMTLADLEIVLDILGSTPEKIHYLVRRSELEEHITYEGDELDLLGLYLDTAFNLGEGEFAGHRWVVVQMSQKIDDYYIAKDQGIARRKPALRSTQWWSDIQNRIERRRPDRWSEAAVMLLNVSFEDQKTAQKLFKKIVKNVKKNWRRPGHRNSIIIEPPKWRTDAFALMAFRERQKEERYVFMENIASQAFSNSHAERCLIIGVNIDKDQYPYSILGVYDRPQENANGNNDDLDEAHS